MSDKARRLPFLVLSVRSYPLALVVNQPLTFMTPDLQMPRLQYTLARRTQEVASVLPSQMRTRSARTGPAQHYLHYRPRCHEHGLCAKIEEGETSKQPAI
jgi:hypothetical protein